MRNAALLAVIALIAAAPASAAPGDLAAGFASGGVYTGTMQTAFAGDVEVDVDVDAQRRPIVAFSHDTDAAQNGSGMRLAVLRLTPSGTLDPSFNSGSPLVLDFSAYSGTANIAAVGIAPGPGGTIYVAGREEFSKIALARLTAAGGYDNSFSGDGRLVGLAPTTTSTWPQALVLDDAGRPLVGGRAVIGGVARAFVARFTTTGAFDGGWDGDGVAALPNLSGGIAELHGLEALPGGGVVGVGHDGVDALTVKLLSTGKPDTGFDGDGQAVSRFGLAKASDPAEAWGVTRDSAGRVVVSGMGANGGNPAPTVLRYLANGAPDAAFGTGSPAPGVVWLPSPPATLVYDVVETCDKKLQLSGIGNKDGQNAFMVARLTEGGARDSSFAPSSAVPGIAVNTFGVYANGQRLKVDGEGVLVGGFRRSTGTDDKPLVVRYQGCGASAATTTGPSDPAPSPPADPAPTTEASVTAAQPRPATPFTTPLALPPAIKVDDAVRFPSTRRCASRRSFAIRLRVPAGATVTSAEVLVNGKRVAVRRGARLRSTVDLRRLPKGRFTVEIRLKLADGRTVSGKRRYRTCTPKRRGGRRPPKV